MISLREIQRLLNNKEFNPYIDIKNPDKVLLHLNEEIGELTRAYRIDESKDLINELGDCVILLCFFAESVNIDLQHATLTKIQENIKTKRFRPFGEMLKSMRRLFENEKL